jgi:glucose/arabinose dehydrogenase
MRMCSRRRPEERKRQKTGTDVTICRVVMLVGASGIGLAAQSAVKPLPPPFHTPSAENRPQVVPQPEGGRVKVPAGFSVGVAAAGFETPRFMLLGPNQEILLSDSARPTQNGGSVYVLIDKDRDGRIDQKTKIIEGLDRPYGLALWKDYLYVAETTSLKRYKYDQKAMKVTGAGEEIVSLKPFTTGHWTRSIIFDPKGEKLYLTVGSGSNVDAGEDPMRAAVHRYNPDGSGHETYVSGTRNVIGLRWYPGTETLWGAVQERDLLGDDLVPDYFTAFKPGAFYGWPYAYIGPHEDPRRKGEAPELAKKTIAPDVLMGSHVAVLDALFYTGKMFPNEYQGGAFVARHGSWNRSKRTGYDVVFVPFKNGRPAGELREFLTGFMISPDKKEVWGRPVGLLQLADGSMLLTDDGGKKIWRISYRAGQTSAGAH